MKCRMEGGYGSAYCKPVKGDGTIHLRRNLRANQRGEELLLLLLVAVVVVAVQPNTDH